MKNCKSIEESLFSSSVLSGYPKPGCALSSFAGLPFHLWVQQIAPHAFLITSINKWYPFFSKAPMVVVQKTKNIHLYLLFIKMDWERVSSCFKHSFKVYFAQEQTIKKLNIFEQNHGLTPLKKSKFGDYVKSIFLKSKKASFLFKRSLNIFSRPFFPETKNEKIQHFWPKSWVNPSEKIQNWWLYKINVFIV